MKTDIRRIMFMDPEMYYFKVLVTLKIPVLFYLMAPGVEPRDPYRLSTCSATEQQPQLFVIFKNNLRQGLVKLSRWSLNTPCILLPKLPRYLGITDLWSMGHTNHLSIYLRMT